MLDDIPTYSNYSFQLHRAKLINLSLLNQVNPYGIVLKDKFTPPASKFRRVLLDKNDKL